MTDRELEQRLRAWYGDGVGDNEAAPTDLRRSVAAIPASTPTPLRRLSRPRGFTLLAAAAILLVGGAIVGGSQLLRLTTVVPPNPSGAPLATPAASADRSPAPTSRPTSRTGDVIAFRRSVQKASTCMFQDESCPVPRVWIVGADGRDAREVVSEGEGGQIIQAWLPDGSGLLYSDNGKLYTTDLSGHRQAVDTGCGAAVPGAPSSCQVDHDVAFSRDGRKIVFVRESNDDQGYATRAVIATMDLATGQVIELTSTSPSGGYRPGWSADGTRIVFSRFGTKDDGGPLPRIKNAIFVVGADGQNLRQISPATLDAFGAAWSPDGERILFLSPTTGQPMGEGDIYTIRPDGSDIRALTKDGRAVSPSWTADGRILFTRSSASGGGTPGWWTVDADGTNAHVLVPSSAIGLAADDLAGTGPAIQPLGGPPVVPPSWKPAPAIAVGPAAPTPTPTPVPDLAPGFTWTGAPTAGDGGPLGETATLLRDGRVLVTEGCGTAAELYDPAKGTFSPAGALSAMRGGKTATLLQDGRVLFTGGYNCGRAGQDGIWASAEIYDPATGTFSPTGSMAKPREFHTATLLTDGRVLIAGGQSGEQPPTTSSAVLASVQTAESSASVLAGAEIYDPATGKFSSTGAMSTFRDHHTATLLKDGRVLVVGGGGEGYASSTSADLYDPSTGRFSRTGSLKSGRWLHTATLLEDGRVVILGGRTAKDSVYRSAETYSPRSGTFSASGLMLEGRQQHTATLLRNGRILIAGGYWSDGRKWRVLSSAEMYDPATGTYTGVGSIGTPRDGHTATRLDDGRVLIVGGDEIGREGGIAVTSALLYQP